MKTVTLPLHWGGLAKDKLFIGPFEFGFVTNTGNLSIASITYKAAENNPYKYDQSEDVCRAWLEEEEARKLAVIG